MTATGMRIGSLFAGYGGAELAVQSVFPDATPAWFVEYDKHPSTILAAHWPDVPNYGDVTQIDWEDEELMGAPRKDALAQRMYDRYCQGLSIEQVGAEFNRSRQAVWKMFTRRGWDMRPKPPAKPKVEFGGRYFTIKEHGYYRATEGDREYLHRAVWRSFSGPIPDGMEIHHRDHDKTNNDISNLQMLSKADHTRLHAEEVVPADSPAVDILTGGYP